MCIRDRGCVAEGPGVVDCLSDEGAQAAEPAEPDAGAVMGLSLIHISEPTRPY